MIHDLVEASSFAQLMRADETTLHALAKHVITDSRQEFRSWMGLAPEPTD